MLSRAHTPAWLSFALLAIVACSSSNPADDQQQAKQDVPARAPAEPEPPLPEPRWIPAPNADRLPPTTDAPALALPSTPEFSTSQVLARYDDGSYSVHGLREQADERLREGEADAKVIVNGWITEVYEPTPACLELDTCAQPHAWIADAPDVRGHRKALLVAQYNFDIAADQRGFWRGYPPVKLEVGKRYRIEGKFVRMSTTGFGDPRGLLEFHAYTDAEPDADGRSEWIYPPGAPWHPVEVYRQEQAERDLLERMGKAP